MVLLIKTTLSYYVIAKGIYTKGILVKIYYNNRSDFDMVTYLF